MRSDVFDLLWRALIVLAAIIVAAGVDAAIFASVDGEMKIFPLAFLFISVGSTILGIPTYLAFKSVDRANWKTAAIAGFLVGAIVPAAVIFFGPSADQASVGGVATVVDGSYTSAGWAQGLLIVAGFGGLGVIGGLLFFSAISATKARQPTEKQLGRSSTWRGGVLIVAALAVAVSLFAVSEASRDRSCHNPLRGGGDSIAPVASFSIKVGPDQWRRVENIVNNFGTQRGWDIFSDVRPTDDFKWFQMSVCREPGTEIAVQGLVEFGDVRISVFQPQGGNGWHEPFVALLNRIELAWPKAVEFEGDKGEKVGRPFWAEALEPVPTVPPPPISRQKLPDR